MAIDALMDGIVALVQSKQSTNTKRHHRNEGENIVNIFERLLMCLGFIILPATTLFALNSQSHNVALFAMCGIRCRTLCVAGAILLSFTRSRNDIISTKLSAFIIGSLTISFGLNGSLIMTGKSGGPVQALGSALQYIAFIIFYLRAMWFLIRGYLDWNKKAPIIERRKSTHGASTTATSTRSVAHLGGIFFQDGKEDNIRKKESNKASLHFSLTYCATVMGCFIAIIATAVPGSSTTYANSTPSALAFQHIVFSILELGVLLFHLRQVKFAAVTRLVRTPLIVLQQPALYQFLVIISHTYAHSC